MVADLDAAGLLVEVKPHKLMTPRRPHRLGDRTLLTDQWFVAMSPGQRRQDLTGKSMEWQKPSRGR